MFRRASLVLMLSVAACSHEPLSYIPQADRVQLQAEARMGEAGGGGRPISVDDMLRNARAAAPADPNAPAPSVPGRLLVRFDGSAVQPDAAQREALRRFATAALADRHGLLVRSEPGSFAGNDASVLGPRRAVAVSRELSDIAPNVDVRFDTALPAGVVVVTWAPPAGNTGAARPDGSGDAP